ncbi:MAG TPA: hypothetical protein VGP92_07890, partial [Acidimicrobiia bacterium]|nr:hypothetical protein [Acidimicrobiia bacterium]
DAVQRMGGAHNLAQTVPLGDLRRAGWSITPWKATTNGSETVTLSRGFADQADLTRRIVDLVGRNGILRQPTVTHDRGWFTSHDEVSLVVDVRRPSIDIVHDTALAARLRAAGVDPVSLQAQIAAQLKSALHVSVIVRLPGGRTRSYDAVSGTVKTVRVAAGGTDWDHVVKFGIGAALALLAALFFLAAGVGVRRNRRRALQRVARGPQPERTPLM